jgi:hypothetical protein
MGEAEGNGLSRRALLQRGGALAAVGLMGPLRLASTAQASDAAAGFTAARRATYIALVEAVGTADATVAKSRPAAAADAFAEWYSRQLLSVREAQDRLLDNVEAGARAGRFSEKARGERLELLRTWIAAAAPATSPLPDPHEVAGPHALRGNHPHASRAAVRKLAAGMPRVAQGGPVRIDQSKALRAQLAISACAITAIPSSDGTGTPPIVTIEAVA